MSNPKNKRYNQSRNLKRTMKNKTRTKKILKTNKLFYIVKSKYLDNEWVKKTLKKHNSSWEEFSIKNPQKKNPDYIHVDQHYANDKYLWKYKAQLKSQIDLEGDINNIDDKYKLIENLVKLNKPKLNKMVLDQYHFNLYFILKKKKI